MPRSFTILLNRETTTRTVAPLDAGTLLDVQVCPCDAFAPLPAFGHLGTMGMSIDGAAVLPLDFPLRWLLQELTPGDARYPDRRLALNCWGAGSRIEITLGSMAQLGYPQGDEQFPRGDGAAVPYMAIFRYETAPAPYLGTPYRFHIARRRLSELLAGSSPMQSVVLQREMLRGAAVAAAVDWDIPARARLDATLSADLAENGIFRSGRPSLHKGILDGLTVSVDGTMTRGVRVPLGIVRPSQQQSLEESLLRLPPQFGNTVAVGVTPPRKVFADTVQPADAEGLEVEFTSVVIERVKERNRT